MPHPSYSRTNESFVRAGIVFPAVVMMGFVLWEGVASVATISMAVSAVLLLWFSHFPRSLDIRTRGAVAIVYTTVLLALHTYLSGGPYASALHVAPVLPLFAVLNGPRWLAASLTAAIFIGIQLVLVGHVIGVDFPSSTDPNLELMFGVEATAAAVIMAFLLARLYDRSVQTAHEERERINRELRSQQRLASMGTMAAGVAHEINNPLTVVLSNMAFVREELEEHGDEVLLEAVQDSIDSASRIARIVKQLGLLGEKSESLVAQTVRDIASDVVQLTAGQMDRVRVVVTVDDAPDVMGPPELLRQVFVNLMVNAAQAMGTQTHEREIWIRTGPVTDEKVEIWVEDTGPGIDPAHLESLFDPFFTTKKVWEGQGLGLAVVAQILDDAGGGVAAENVAPRGARFRVTLPRATKNALPASRTGEFDGHIGGDSSLQILIVDDEIAVTRALTRLLGAHTVSVAHSGDAALRLLEQRTDFDLVLMDLSMPVMNGIELCNEVVRRHPELAEKLVFLTGGAVDASTRAFVRETTHTVLYKPVDTVRLTAVIDELCVQGPVPVVQAPPEIDPTGIAPV